MSTPTPPPGWYPNSAGQMQWWDGSMWTNHVAPPASAVAPAAPGGPFPAVALTGMILGIAVWVLAPFTGWFAGSIIGLSVALAAVVCGAIGFAGHRTTGRGYGFGLTGIILGGIALTFMLGWLIFTFASGVIPSASERLAMQIAVVRRLKRPVASGLRHVGTDGGACTWG